ncbi:MAG TPA: radical SAM protein [Verrucomicrobiae bacterium]|nr:radical SAM protein [Verrucomicrobiae bacterium]
MRILLILPAGENVRVTRQRPRVPKRAMLRFSVLPLTTVAALTPPEHEVQIVDENVEALDFSADCDVVGITLMTALAPRAYEIAREFRARGRVVVGGGFHVTLCPDEARQHFNAIVVGDAEGAWPALLRDVEAGRLRKIYSSPPTGKVVLSAQSRWQLLRRNAKHYVTLNAIQATRGCSHGCRYCSVTAFHRRIHRQRPVADVVAELEHIARNFMFVDDNIIAHRAYACELFRAMTPLRKRWVTQCSIEIADDTELLQLARAAGCRGLFIGVETISAENLTAMDKGFNDSRRYRERLHQIRCAGIGVVAGIIVGLDRDDVTVFQRTLRFLEWTGVDTVQVNILTPLPGTPLFEDFARTGRIRDREWNHYDFRHCVIEPARMSSQELQNGADWLRAQFYRLDRILVRFARGIFVIGWIPALLGLKLNLTYRRDNRREQIVGRNPAQAVRVTADKVVFGQEAACVEG